jgi:hypothetical protein
MGSRAEGDKVNLQIEMYELPDANVVIKMQCIDCNHIQNVKGIRRGGSCYFGSSYDFCDECEGVPRPIEQTATVIEWTHSTCLDVGSKVCRAYRP